MASGLTNLHFVNSCAQTAIFDFDLTKEPPSFSLAQEYQNPGECKPISMSIQSKTGTEYQPLRLLIEEIIVCQQIYNDVIARDKTNTFKK